MAAARNPTFDDDEFDEIVEEYMNADDIETLREHKLRTGLRSCELFEGNNSVSMPNINTLPSDTKRQPYERMNKTKPLPPTPPRKKPNVKVQAAFMPMHSEDEAVNRTNNARLLASRSSGDLAGRRQLRSNIEQPTSSHFLQVQRQHASTLPPGLSNANPDTRMPAAKHPPSIPAPLRHVVSQFPEEDEPPTEWAPAPPPPPNPSGVADRAKTVHWSSDNNSSGFASSATSPPRTPNSRVTTDRVKSQPSKMPQKVKKEDLSRFSWYKAWMSREEAERKLHAYKENGSFVVRNSRTGLNKPYVITILCRREIFHVPIRLRTKDSYYAVGEEKSDELRFETVEDVIKHFHLNPVDLVTDSKKQDEVFRTVLVYHRS